ncbi:hypothetical protein QTH90_09490 [Variovorax sp. J2P1-59]|uniref:hypothetical protein n=1 Tax=Variovorax flavidus TaxID=3053501 RepID=UPI0025755F0E|nr:hypothetical protein [Variovorax sp. J2P1-59]MDM0074612.1 hypothetical protein [Variovorax sp. J2P1-59]
MAEAIYCFDTATVRFAIYPEGGARVVAEIGEDPLRDLFGATGGGDSLTAAYVRNAALIDERALELHRSGKRPVRLETHDFELTIQDTD